MNIEITKQLAEKVLKTVDAGLSHGLGEPVPGQMCVEAAVCYALGQKHGDKPACVHPLLRQVKISLNDSKIWRTVRNPNTARAKGLRRIAIAQLGTKGTLDTKRFSQGLANVTLIHLGEIQHERLKELKEAGARQVWRLAQRHGLICAKVKYGKCKAPYYDNPAQELVYLLESLGDKRTQRRILRAYIEDITLLLIAMQTPGSKFLYLTNK